MNFLSVIVEFGTFPRWPLVSFLGVLGGCPPFPSFPSLPSLPSLPLLLSRSLFSPSLFLALALSLLFSSSPSSRSRSRGLWPRPLPPVPLALGGSCPVPSRGCRSNGSNVLGSYGDARFCLFNLRCQCTATAVNGCLVLYGFA